MDGVSYRHLRAMMEHHQGVGIKYILFSYVTRRFWVLIGPTALRSRCAAEADVGHEMEEGRVAAGGRGIDDVL